MKKLKLLFFALICILPFSVNALEENTCEVFLKGTYEYTTEDEANLKKEWLEAKVESLNNGDGIFGDFRFSYKIEENDVSEMVKTNFETVNVSDKFTSKEDAVKHYDEITLDWGYVKENPTVLEHKEQLINKSEEVTVICNSDDCELEKQNIMDALLPNQRPIFSDITYKEAFGKEVSEEYKVDNKVYYFDTEQEANEFIKNYEPSKEGYRFENNTVVEETVVEKNFVTYEDTFDTLKEAEDALADFVSTHVDVTQNPIEKLRDESEDKIEEGSFETYDKAEYDNWINENVYSNENGELTYKENNPREETESIDINKEFTSEDEANQYRNYLEDLKNKGYTVDVTENSTSEITGEVTSAIKIDSRDLYNLNKNETNYVLIKQGSNGVAVWTENELTNAKKQIFVDTYNNYNNTNDVDGSTKNLTLDSVYWVFGYDLFDLSETFGNNWGTYTFIDNGDTITLKTDKKKVSHIVYGLSKENVTKWYFNGSASKTSICYSLDYTKTTYGFDYKVSASGNTEESSTKYKVVSHFKEILNIPTFTYYIETIIDNIYYTLSYDKYIPMNKITTYVNWEILKCKINEDVDDSVVTVKTNNYPNPPQTGVSGNSYINYILILGIVFASYKAYKLSKN